MHDEIWFTPKLSLGKILMAAVGNYWLQKGEIQSKKNVEAVENRRTICMEILLAKRTQKNPVNPDSDKLGGHNVLMTTLGLT